MKRERHEERLVSTLGEAGHAPGAGLRELKRLNSGKGVMGTVTYTSAAKLVLDSWSKRHSAPRLLFHASQVVWPLFICVSAMVSCLVNSCPCIRRAWQRLLGSC